ncbi:hypothetical protein D3C86_2258830 [compost metagenome]
MIILGEAGTDEEEFLLTELGEREVADQLAVVLQHRRQRHPTRCRDAAGEHAIEPGFRPRPLDLVFGKA